MTDNVIGSRGLSGGWRREGSCQYQEIGLCKPWKKGGEDKKTVGQVRKAQDAQQQLKEVFLRPSSTAK
jgi:hypothetical protein